MNSSRLVILVFTLILGVVTTPVMAQAPPAGKTYRIGWLSPASAENGRPNLDALRQGLRQLGYAEGRNIALELRWADSATERLAELRPTSCGSKSTSSAPRDHRPRGRRKGATATIPVVFSNVAFPNQTGLVASYARPGGNVTGVALVGPEYGKRLELLKEANPKLTRVALISELPIEQPIEFDMVLNAQAAKTLGVTFPETLRLRADQVIE